ncbi:cell division protein ZipA [Shewanella schlegeliana]|uniref:Cell division protein ZipA n=1 Tax=Shewanella schlegeliana TaxID=190308 RepID=A0ABS1SX05_9GAMM|nr:cell division protein ZipA [Shewanella schlegeliana]MBL4913078.1 cell division protein ZipA [Shewanella schlegeliana]MCL1111092.1 cell division protein ZipA [Shewanella schlegeliana]GIU28343.1 cell division protein ZipA [Shewanella schlegeliana]
MENFQLVLLLIGVIAIIAVLVHGFWSIRKQQPKGYKQSPMADISRERRDADGFDNDGIGEVRVVKNSGFESEAETVDEHQQESQFNGTRADSFELSDTPAPKVTKTRVEPSLMTQEPVLTAEAPIQESLFATEEPVFTEPEIAKPKITEPVFEAAPKVIEQEAVEQEIVETKPEPISESKQAQVEELGEPQDVLVLHVVAKEGEELSGAELLPCLLTLNFKFGDMNIFHRHEDNAGTGKVLFSMANMVKPGVFDPDNMEQFSTQGVVLFMTLPCYGDALMNFSIMLNSAHQIADDLGGVVLDGGRGEWLESTKQSYIQRIRTLACA